MLKKRYKPNQQITFGSLLCSLLQVQSDLQNQKYSHIVYGGYWAMGSSRYDIRKHFRDRPLECLQMQWLKAARPPRATLRCVVPARRRGSKPWLRAASASRARMAAARRSQIQSDVTLRASRKRSLVALPRRAGRTATPPPPPPSSVFP